MKFVILLETLKTQEHKLDQGQSALLRDLWATYDMQIVAMIKAKKEGRLLTASLHERMAHQLLDAYFEMIEKVMA